MWPVVLLGTLVDGLVFGSIASGSGVAGVSATFVIIGYCGVSRFMPDLKWISDISRE